MKIEKAKSEFTPVVITLETQAELNALIDLCKFKVGLSGKYSVDIINGFAIDLLQTFNSEGL